MKTFHEYMINEMPKPLKSAAVAGDAAKFKSELLSAFYKTKGNLENPGSAKYSLGAKNVVINQQDDNHVWPFMTFEVDSPDGTKKVEVSVPNIEDVTQITDFLFTVDGDQKSFGTRTDKGAKRTGDIEAGVSYMIYAIKQAALGGKRAAARKAKMGQSLTNMSDEELEAELARRRELNSGGETIPSEEL